MSDWVSQGSPWSTEKGFGALASQQRHPPLDQLVEGAESQCNADSEKHQHPPRPHEAEAQQNLACEQRGGNALDEMAELVIRVAAEIQPILHPEAQRYACIGIGAAKDEDQRMDGDHDIEQARQW